MKKLIKKLSTIVLAIFIFSILSNVSIATENPLELDSVLNANITDLISENIEENTAKEEKKKGNDVYQIGEEVILTEDVLGNVYIIAEKINIEDINIDGNVFLVSSEINIKNTYISGAAYIVGEQIELNSLIKDIYVVGQNIVLGNSSYITRTARIASESINISGLIDGDCFLDTTNLTIGNDTTILGTLNYTVSEKENISEKAKISDVIKNEITPEEKIDTEKILAEIQTTFESFHIISVFFKTIIIMLVLVLIFRNCQKVTENVSAVKVVGALGKGLLAVIIIPIISLILIITIMGAGIGLIFLLIYFILLYISSYVTSLVIASNIVKEYSRSKIFGLGILIHVVYNLICLIPTIGGFIAVLYALIGVGFIFNILFYKEEKKDEGIVEE